MAAVPARKLTGAKSRLRVKFMAKGHRGSDHELWLRQFPGRTPHWGECEFVFDQEASRYDWLVVYDDLAPVGEERFSSRIERLPCGANNTVLVTAEPSSVKVYGSAFTRQFGWVLTSQEPWALDHPRTVRSQTGYRWFYGVGRGRLLDYDALDAAEMPEKSNAVSTICSSKAQTHTLHARRLAFTRALAAELPDLAWFGRGIRAIDDKAEAIDPYAFHLAVENHIAPHHFTEKLADTFLGFAMPVYHGAPDLADYFPPESFLSLPTLEPTQAAEILRKAMVDARAAKARSALVEARRRVLERYNLFATLAAFIENRHDRTAPSSDAVIKGRHRARIAGPRVMLGDLIERRRVKRRLRRIGLAAVP